jgi:hypothetical protein
MRIEKPGNALRRIRRQHGMNIEFHAKNSPAASDQP